MTIRSKLPEAGVTIFTVMTQMANAHGAINLSQGFPDFNVHTDLIALVAKHMREGRNQYAPMQGVPELRHQIARKVERLYARAYDPDREITITHGATEALFAAITATVHPGDEVLLFEPAYDAYGPAVTLSGGTPVFVKLKHPDYRIDWNEVQDRLSDRTRLIVLNSPHNPTGAILGAEDIKSLKRVLSSSRARILSDEVYEHMVFDDSRHESIARDEELARKSFVVSSFGKTYHATGWKVGYALAPADMTEEMRKVHQFLTFAVNTPIQHAYAEFMAREEIYEEVRLFYQEKRDLFASLVAPSRFSLIPCRGTYFQMLDYSAVSDAPDTEFARQLILQHGVAAIPPSVFYHDGEDRRVLRFCFAKKDDTLREAAQRLCKI